MITPSGWLWEDGFGMLTWQEDWWRIVLAMGPNCRVVSRSGSTRIRTVATGFTTRKTWTIGHGPVLPPKTEHIQLIILAPIKYLSSDDITTWSIHRLCSICLSFTSPYQICDPTSTHWVTIENLQIAHKICNYFTTIQWISVGLQIWMGEM
jgi:hypothetical protein